MAHTASQKYLSTRGGSYGVSNPLPIGIPICPVSYDLQLSFEDVVLKGLAADGGLFIPEAIPTLPNSWTSDWKDLSFEELAFEILSLYISPSEIPPQDLKDIIKRSYSTFRRPEVTPLVHLDEKKHLYLLELFHGREFAEPSWLGV